MKVVLPGHRCKCTLAVCKGTTCVQSCNTRDPEKHTMCAVQKDPGVASAEDPNMVFALDNPMEYEPTIGMVKTASSCRLHHLQSV